MQERARDKDFFLIESERVRTCLSPRIIIVEKGGNFPLVPYQGTSWLGLPGGKVKEAEVGKDNFLSAGSFPTLTREIWEECGIDISGCLGQAACLGLAEIATVDNVARQITLTRTPIFVCRITSLGNINAETQLVNIASHLPGPLFPDARAGITRLKEVIRQKEPIQPEWFNKERIYYFMLKPEIGLLMGPPSWIY